MSTWPAAVLFDFDGVIVNSEPVHCRAFQAILADVGLDLTDEMYYDQLIGFDDRGAFAHVFDMARRPLDATAARDLERRKAKLVQQVLADVRALPGADALVRGLGAAGVPMAICSGALRSEIDPMLAGTGLAGFFPVIVAAEDVAVGKPDPSGYLLAMGRLGQAVGATLLPGDCLIIEDAPTVIRAAKGIGFKTMGVATTGPAAALADADYVVADLDPATIRRQLPKWPGGGGGTA